MAKKIKTPQITEEELIRAINNEGLGFGHPYESEVNIQDKKEKKGLIPGTIGIAKSYDTSNVIAYCVNEQGKLYKTSVHKTWEEGYGMVLRRYREFAKLDAEKGIMHPNEPSFHFGPQSEWRNKELSENRISIDGTENDHIKNIISFEQDGLYEFGFDENVDSGIGYNNLDRMFSETDIAALFPEHNIDYVIIGVDEAEDLFIKIKISGETKDIQLSKDDCIAMAETLSDYVESSMQAYFKPKAETRDDLTITDKELESLDKLIANDQMSM